MDRFLNKKYKVDRVENYDEFFTEMGMKTLKNNLKTVKYIFKILNEKLNF
jgi:hypothetical protein